MFKRSWNVKKVPKCGGIKEKFLRKKLCFHRFGRFQMHRILQYTIPYREFMNIWNFVKVSVCVSLPRVFESVCISLPRVSEDLECFKSLDIVYYGNVIKPLIQCVSEGLWNFVSMRFWAIRKKIVPYFPKANEVPGDMTVLT